MWLRARAAAGGQAETAARPAPIETDVLGRSSPTAYSASLRQPLARGGSLWHYGKEHHWDYYAPRPIAERAKLEREALAARAEWRRQRLLGRPGAPPTEEELEDARNLEIHQRQRLESHVSRVEALHGRLRQSAQIEESYLYLPEQFPAKQSVSFEQWQELEEERLVARRQCAIAADNMRPEMNRRLPPTSLWYKLRHQVLPGKASGASEPGHWPRRRFYYPATNFAMLQDPQQKPEEELELERRVKLARMNFTGVWLFPATTFGILWTLNATAVHRFRVVATTAAVGMTAEWGNAMSKAWRPTQDLDDFRLAKLVWFVKNKPDVFADVQSGVMVKGDSGLTNMDDYGREIEQGKIF